MSILQKGISGVSLDSAPPERRAALMRNARSFKALTLSTDPFPKLTKAEIKRLRIPTLIITGEATITIHKLVNEELARLLPHAASALIPKAGHASIRENPLAFNRAVFEFLKKQKQ
jgi:pimeloyl-ACP methyl ester carboxylesterase